MQALAMPASRYIFGTLPWYSVTMVCAILSALLLAQGEEKRRGLPKDTVVDLALRLIPCGIIGARLYYVAFTWSLFRENPIAILEIWKGGLAIYGGLIGGFLAALVFARRRKLNLLTLIDMIVPGLALAQCIGRWGNYFNMEAYGLPITNPAFQFFPMAVLIPEGGTQVWHMATFFYESLWDFGVFIALRCLRKPCRRPGDLFGWYVLLYGAGRLIIEGLRMDSLMTSGGSARISQLLSVVGCLIVYLLMTCHALRHKRKTVVSFGLLCALAIAVVVYLLPAPAEAFYGYRLAFAVQVGSGLHLRQRTGYGIEPPRLAISTVCPCAAGAGFSTRGISAPCGTARLHRSLSCAVQSVRSDADRRLRGHVPLCQACRRPSEDAAVSFPIHQRRRFMPDTPLKNTLYRLACRCCYPPRGYRHCRTGRRPPLRNRHLGNVQGRAL